MASSPGSDPTGAGDRGHHVTFDAGVSVDVVEAIADRKGVDPTEVDFHLDEHVDADALDALARHASANDDASWSLEFDVAGVSVTVLSDGRITVD